MTEGYWPQVTRSGIGSRDMDSGHCGLRRSTVAGHRAHILRHEEIYIYEAEDHP
jgi:hypothetical protein